MKYQGITEEINRLEIEIKGLKDTTEQTNEALLKKLKKSKVFFK